MWVELVCRGGGEGGRERGGVSLTSLSLLSTADAEVVCMHREIGALPAELKFRIQKLTLVSNFAKDVKRNF